MFVAAFLALWIGSNLPISVGLVWLTNPITMPPIFYTTYKIGAWILGTPPVNISWEWHTIHSELATIWWPLMTGSVVCGLLFSGLSYLAINRLWIWQVRRRWQKRLLKARASKN
jgi:uncharacterized protein (DUF2062 family)